MTCPFVHVTAALHMLLHPAAFLLHARMGQLYCTRSFSACKPAAHMRAKLGPKPLLLLRRDTWSCSQHNPQTLLLTRRALHTHAAHAVDPVVCSFALFTHLRVALTTRRGGSPSPSGHGDASAGPHQERWTLISAATACLARSLKGRGGCGPCHDVERFCHYTHTRARARTSDHVAPTHPLYVHGTHQSMHLQCNITMWLRASMLSKPSLSLWGFAAQSFPQRRMLSCFSVA